MRVMRLGLLGSELRSLHLTTQRGGWLSAGANYRLFQLAASVFILLFTTSSIVSCAFIWRDWGRGQGPNYRLSQLEAPAFTLLAVTISSIVIPRTPHRLPPDAALRSSLSYSGHCTSPPYPHIFADPDRGAHPFPSGPVFRHNYLNHRRLRGRCGTGVVLHPFLAPR
jgi:hypothetical protein